MLKGHQKDIKRRHEKDTLNGDSKRTLKRAIKGTNKRSHSNETLKGDIKRRH